MTEPDLQSARKPDSPAVHEKLLFRPGGPIAKPSLPTRELSWIRQPSAWAGGMSRWKVLSLAIVGFPMLAGMFLLIVGMLVRTTKEKEAEKPAARSEWVDPRPTAPSPPACGWLGGPLTTGAWRDHENGEWGCLSGTYEVPSDTLGLRNSLAYHVNGDVQHAREAHLTLNVTDKSTEPQARRALMLAARELVMGAAGTEMTPQTEKAIQSGRPGRWTMGGRTFELTKETWPTGKGYDLRFMINLDSRK